LGYGSRASFEIISASISGIGINARVVEGIDEIAKYQWLFYEVLLMGKFGHQPIDEEFAGDIAGAIARLGA